MNSRDNGYSCQVKIRCAPSEVVRLKELAEAAGLSQSALMRRWINGRRVTAAVDFKAIAEMRKQGGLLKHVALELYGRKLLEMRDFESLFGFGRKIMEYAREVRDDLQKGERQKG